MKIFYTLLILFVFGMSSCQKETISLDDKVVVDPPQSYKGAYYSGIVTSDENRIENAKVSVYQNGIKRGKTITNAKGQYSTLNIELEIGKDVTFEIEKDLFYTKIKRTSSSHAIYKNTDFRIYKENITEFEVVSSLKKPEDTTNVKIYGTFSDINHNRIEKALCWAFWDVEKVEDNKWGISGTVEYTDENGHFELLVPANKQIYFFSVKKEARCARVLNIDDQTGAIDFLPLQDIGKLEQDLEIISVEDINFEGIFNLIKGKFLHCDGTPVIDGNILVNELVDEGTGDGFVFAKSYDITEFDEEGKFRLRTRLCLSDVDVKFEFYGTTNTSFVTEFEADFQEDIMDIGELVACKDISTIVDTNKMEMTIYIGDSTRFIKGYFLHEPTTTANTIDQYGLGVVTLPGQMGFGKMKLRIEDVQYGENDISLINFDANITFSLNATDGAIKAYVTDIRDGFIYGYLSGLTDINNTGMESITGTFKFYDY